MLPLGRVLCIGAGAFATSCIIAPQGAESDGSVGSAYVWGDGGSCGQLRDVRVPMRVGIDDAHSCTLGDGFGIVVVGSGAQSWGVRGPQLGIGASPKHFLQELGGGMFRAGELMRFDVTHVGAKKPVQSVPLPLRLGHRGVRYVACGDTHVVALTNEGEVFEWGQREALKPDGKINDP